VTSYFSKIVYFSGLPVVLSSIDIFAQFAVPMFILLSGIVLSLRYDGEYSVIMFYKKRINRLLIPYVIWSIIYIIVNIISNPDLSISRMIFMIFTGTAYYHLWFFFLIFQLYFIFPFYRKLLKDRSILIIFITFVIQILFNHYKIGIVEDVHIALIIKRLFLSHIFYFSLGIWVADNINKVEILLSKTNKYAVLILLMLAVHISYVFSFNWLAVNNHFFEAFNTLIILEKILLPLLYVLIFIVLYLFSVRLRSTKFKNFMEVISKYSFGIYLSHALILFAIIKVLKPVKITPDNISFYCITFVGTFLLSMVFCFIIERTLLSKYLLSIDQKKKVE
jgi:surface polysaccharide O-acyltransferase-like enzyme